MIKLFNSSYFANPWYPQDTCLGNLTDFISLNSIFLADSDEIDFLRAQTTESFLVDTT